MTDTAEQRELYRLKGEGLEITYRRANDELVVEIADSDLSHLSGRREATAVMEPDIGLRIDEELLFSRGGVRVILTLLLPEINPAEMGGNSAEVNGAAIITHAFKGSAKQQPNLHSYDVRELKGEITLEA